jgi:hypothetical protein
MATKSISFVSLPYVVEESEKLNLEVLKFVYNNEKETDRKQLDIPLLRMQAIPTLLFHEKLGIVAMFTERRPRTRKIIDDWIYNTPNLSYNNISRDLETLKEFLLSCEDLFDSDDEKEYINEAMKFLLKNRISYCDCNVKKLTIILNL